MEWKEMVTDISANIFPDLSAVEPPFKFGSYEPSPNVPLQMFLFFNIHYFPFWCLSYVIFLNWKFDCLGNLTRFLTIAVIIMIVLIEFIRLYLGYLGNLSERIPELAGFWILTILLQFPLQTFLFVNPYLYPRPAELIMNCIMWLLIISELLTGFFALKKGAARAKQYYILKSHLWKLAACDSESSKIKTE